METIIQIITAISILYELTYWIYKVIKTRKQRIKNNGWNNKQYRQPIPDYVKNAKCYSNDGFYNCTITVNIKL